jgi:aminopeptidase YwaD
MRIPDGRGSYPTRWHFQPVQDFQTYYLGEDNKTCCFRILPKIWDVPHGSQSCCALPEHKLQMNLMYRSIVVLAAFTTVVAVGCTSMPTAKTPVTPSATPAPTDSPAPTPTPTTVTPESLSGTTFGYLRELVEELGPRESATEEEREAAEYLASQFADLGYSVEMQPFSVEKLSPEQSGLTPHLDTRDSEKIEVLPLSGSSFGEVSGMLVPVGLGGVDDIPAEALEGRIALIERGEITFQSKARNARDAGAVGVVIYNNEDGNFRGNLGYSADFPVVSISESDGERLRDLASATEIEATLSLQMVESPSQNVIAEKPGTSQGVVVIGAHYDTVPNVPGANDNASGTAVVLMMAQDLSGRTLPFTVRFIAFGSEELGLLGSRAYVDSLLNEEREQMAAMLNFDALGSGSSLGVAGDPDLTRVVVEQGRRREIGIEIRPGLQGGSSDHASFASVGVPVIMFFSNDFSRIHTPQDTLEFINPDLPGGAARLGLDLLDELANSP